MHLYGWPVDDVYSDPDLDDNTSYNADLSTLVPVDVGLPSGKTEPTSKINLAINLDADEVATAPVSVGGLIDPLSDIPDYSRTIRTYDSLGKSHDVILEFRRTYGPAATQISTLDDLDPQDQMITQLGFIAGETIEVTVGGGALETFTVVAAAPGIPESTMGDLLNFVNNYNAGAPGPGDLVHAFLNDNGEIVISANDFANGQDLTLGGSGLARLGFAAGTFTPILGMGLHQELCLQPIRMLFHRDDNTFPTLATLPGNSKYNADGWWQVDVVSPEFGSPLTSGLVNFNNDGSLNALGDANKAWILSLLVLTGRMVTLNYKASPLMLKDLPRYSGPYNVAYANQNGSELGLKTSIDIDSEGYVNARFSNGTSARIYKLLS